MKSDRPGNWWQFYLFESKSPEECELAAGDVFSRGFEDLFHMALQLVVGLCSGRVRRPNTNIIH